MQIYRQLRDYSTWNHWREGFIWLAWSLVGGLFPVWLTIIVLKLMTQAVHLQAFTDNGEFALYSASYVATTLYLLFKDFKDFRNEWFSNRSLLCLLLVVLLLSAATMFTVTCLLNVLGAGKPEVLHFLNRPLLRQMSFIVFPLSMLVSLLVVVIDNIRTMPDPNKITAKQREKLDSEFDNLP